MPYHIQIVVYTISRQFYHYQNQQLQNVYLYLVQLSTQKSFLRLEPEHNQLVSLLQEL